MRGILWKQFTVKTIPLQKQHNCNYCYGKQLIRKIKINQSVREESLTLFAVYIVYIVELPREWEKASLTALLNGRHKLLSTSTSLADEQIIVQESKLNCK